MGGPGDTGRRSLGAGRGVSRLTESMRGGGTQVPKHFHQNGYIKLLRVLCNRFDATQCCRKLSRKQIDHEVLRLHKYRTGTGPANCVLWQEGRTLLRENSFITFNKLIIRFSGKEWGTFRHEPVCSEGEEAEFYFCEVQDSDMKLYLVLVFKLEAGKKRNTLGRPQKTCL